MKEASQEEAKEEPADAIGDVNRPLDAEDLEETETPKYQDGDGVLEAQEKVIKSLMKKLGFL